MSRLGRNIGGYFGDRIEATEVLRETLALAEPRGWNIERIPATADRELVALTRPPVRTTPWVPRIYISTGIHGDEPAGPLAVRRLFERDAFPDLAWIWCCPCLNPGGFPLNSRASPEGVDLNRDYRCLTAPETRAHVGWLQRQPVFDLALCLHEDWEAAGFYVYELNPMSLPPLAVAMISAVETETKCPIDPSPLIEGREAQGGIIRPQLDPVERPEWPESLFLIQNKTRLSYTLEAPSDFPLALRVDALEVAVRAALKTFIELHPPTGPVSGAPLPP